MDLKNIQLSSQERKDHIPKATAAGFPPYVRGNDSSGYLLKFPKIIRTIDTELESYSFQYKDKNSWEKVPFIIQKIQKAYQRGKINTPILVCEITDDISLDWIALIRAIRMSWFILNQKNEKKIIPLEVKVQTPFGYHPSLLKILSAEIDGIISEVLTESIMKDFINDFKLLKTIDPFGGSKLIETKTKSYSEKMIQKITS